MARTNIMAYISNDKMIAAKNNSGLPKMMLKIIYYNIGTFAIADSTNFCRQNRVILNGFLPVGTQQFLLQMSHKLRGA